MGRKSSLTADQWIELERRHVVGGESINSLAIEYGVNESSVRRKIKPNKAEPENSSKPLKQLAFEKIEADKAQKRIAEQIAELPFARQQIVSDLYRKLNSISEHLGSAAEYGAMTAHRIAGIANAQIDKIDDADPMESQETLQAISALTKISNDASVIPMALLNANKDFIRESNSGGTQNNADLLKELVESLPL